MRANLSWEARLALRRLRAAPVFTSFAIVTLALGIGATTAIYSVIYTVLLKPPAIENVEEVVNLYHWDPSRGGSIPRIAFSWPDYTDLARLQTSAGRYSSELSRGSAGNSPLPSRRRLWASPRGSTRDRLDRGTKGSSTYPSPSTTSTTWR